MIISISWKVEPKLRGWGEDALSKRPSNPHDPHGRPNAYLAAKQPTRARRSASIEGSRSHGAQSASRKRGSEWVESESRSPQLGFYDSRMVQSTPSMSKGREERPPNQGLIPSLKAQLAPWLQYFEGESRSPQSGSHDSHMVQLTPSTSEGERRDPPIRGSYHLARPNWPLNSSILRARADPPNQGLVTLIWSNRPPLQVRVRGETPKSGAHTISQSPIGPQFEFMRARTDPPNQGLMTLVQSNRLSHRSVVQIY